MLKATKMGLKMALVAAAVALVAGCAGKAPPYQPSIRSVQVLKAAGTNPVRVGEFGVKPGAVGATSISLRANSISSPVGDSFGAYLGEALRQELDLAKRLDPNAVWEVSGTLLGNDIDTAIGTAKGYADAQFVVKKNGQVVFDKVKRGEASWESSFAAAIAVPKAQQSYPLIIQNLLWMLYADSDFLNALK